MEEITIYILTQKEKQIANEVIVLSLQNAGWTEAEIRNAFKRAGVEVPEFYNESIVVDEKISVSRQLWDRNRLLALIGAGIAVVAIAAISSYFLLFNDRVGQDSIRVYSSSDDDTTNPFNDIPLTSATSNDSR